MISQLDNESVTLTGEIFLKKLSTKQQYGEEKRFYMDNLSLFLATRDGNVYQLTIAKSSFVNFGDGEEWSMPSPLSPVRSQEQIIEVLS